MVSLRSVFLWMSRINKIDRIPKFYSFCHFSHFFARDNPCKSVSRQYLIAEMLFLHFNGYPVTIHQTLRQAQGFGKFIAEEITQGEHFALIKI